MSDTTNRTEYTATSRRTRCLCTFTWTIADFDTVCPKDCGEIGQITSPAFTAGEEVGKTSQCKLPFFFCAGSFRCVSVAGKGGKVELSLFRLADESEETEGHVSTSILCKYKISLDNPQNVHIITKMGEHTFDDEDDNWGTELMKVHDLYDHSNKETLLVEDNKLRVHLEMAIEGNMACSISTQKGHHHQLKRKRESEADTLSSHLQTLFQSNNKEHTDVHIKCGQSSFYCHRVILAARSNAFKKMLEEKESTIMTEIVIDEDHHFDPPLLSMILRYIYTGKIDLTTVSTPFSHSFFMGVIRGADKFELEELKNYSFERILENHLSEDSVGEVMVAAHTYRANEEIKESLQKFFKTKIKTLMEIPAFRQLLSEHWRIFFPETENII